MRRIAVILLAVLSIAAIVLWWTFSPTEVPVGRDQQGGKLRGEDPQERAAPPLSSENAGASPNLNASDAAEKARATPGSVSGCVADAGGRPLKDVKVDALLDWSPIKRSLHGELWGGDSVETAVTQADGRYQLTGLQARRVWVRASSRDFEERVLWVEIPSTSMDFRLDRVATIAGRIMAPDGAPLPEFKLRALGSAGREWDFDGSQASDGRFELKLWKGVYVLQAEVPGFAPTRSPSFTVLAGERREGVVINLNSAAVIEGTVVARDSGTPVEQVTITAIPRANFGLPFVTQSGRRGAFRLDGLPEAEYRVRFYPPKDPFPDLGVIKKVDRETVSAGETKMLLVQLGAGGAMKGSIRVAGVAASNLCSEVNLELSGPGEFRLGVDAESRFQIRHLTPGEYEISAWGSLGEGKSFQVDRRVDVVEGETAQVDIDVEPTLSVKGRVTLGGAPGAGLFVQAGHFWRPAESWYPFRSHALSSSLTDASGNYELRLPAGEPLTVILRPGGEAWIESPLTLPLEADGARFDMALGARSLSGRVVDKETSEPIEGALIELFAVGGTGRSYRTLASARRAGTKSDAGGRFEILFPPAGTYSVMASESGFAVARVDDVQVEATGEIVELRLAMNRGLPFWFHVTDSGGYPVSRAKYILRDSSGRLISLRPEDDMGGLLGLVTPRPGEYEATIIHASFAPARVAFRVPGEVWERGVTLTSGAELRALVVDSGAKPVKGAEIVLRNDRGEDPADDLMPEDPLNATPLRAIVTERDGTARWKHIVPGSYQVSARKGDLHSREQTIIAEDGRTVEVKLTLGEKRN